MIYCLLVQLIPEPQSKKFLSPKNKKVKKNNQGMGCTFHQKMLEVTTVLIILLYKIFYYYLYYIILVKGIKIGVKFFKN